MASHPVSQQQYSAVTGQSPSANIGEDHPVESVSWLDAIEFCNLLSVKSDLPEYYAIEMNQLETPVRKHNQGFRLPTDAEWEYACKAGGTAPRYGEIEEIAWFACNSGERSHPIGQKAPNAWGLYDMLGNVWEWCWDLYDPAVYGNYRIFRGGGWSDEERGCLATNRRRSHPTFSIDDLGFRVARSLPGG
ncbi:MAG: formylglycine-generating enzyme family protein [bacterium]